MKLIVEINQETEVFKHDPTKTVQSCMTEIGRRLTQGSVEGSTLTLDGKELCSWRVVEYTKDGVLIKDP